jgi:hypothetical protein
VLHESRIAPVPAQVQHMRQASTNRAQFASVNNGRPQVFAAPAPLATAYRAPAPHEGAVPAARALPRIEARPQPAAMQPRPQVEPNARPAAQPMRNEHPNPLQPSRPAVENRPEARPTPQPRAEQRPAPQPHIQQRPAPEPKAQQRPAPEVHQEVRPAPKKEEKPEPKREEPR